MKEALEGATEADRQRVSDMLKDLNELLEAHNRGEDTSEMFDEFMDAHGDFFPENPRNTEELIDSLAQRAAAAQQFYNSLTPPEQQAELDQLAQQAFGSPDLMSQLAQMDSQLRAARPGLDWDNAQSFSGDQPMGLGEGAEALRDISELEALSEQLSQQYAGAQMDDIDLDALARQLGDEAAVDARMLAELEKALSEEGGFFDRAADGQLRLSPKAMRQLGQSIFRDIAEQLSGRRGDRQTRRTGLLGERPAPAANGSSATPTPGMSPERCQMRCCALSPRPPSRRWRRRRWRGPECGSTSATSRSRRPRAAPRRRSCCSSTPRSPWRWRVAGHR